MRIAPDATSKARKWCFMRWSARKKNSMLQPASKNGTASPAE